ncbi:hypothetical protein ACJ73_04276 [Blastomyces percursus]|uniref:Uncharacterized protein n=1 Tax=Blastomyces percursus TaxID=1658174 RepID=A0A1J9Q8F5_9EURO|nr:hypothetical protein ACJ73_04276 [Blastomyces percursus]
MSVIAQQAAPASAGADQMDINSQTAVAQGRAVRVKQLWTSGADIKNFTAMKKAIKSNRHGMVNLLLELGADKPPLVTAVSIGNLGMVRFLIDKGVPVNRNDRLQETLLSLAARQGHPEIVQLLLDRGAEVDAVNRNGTEYATALIAATFLMHEDVVAT